MLYPATLICGGVPAALHYICFSRILARLTIVVCGIPLVGYIYDYGAPTPKILIELGVNSFFAISLTADHFPQGRQI